MFKIGDLVIKPDEPELGVGTVVLDNTPFASYDFTVEWATRATWLWEKSTELQPANMTKTDAQVHNLCLEREALENQYSKILAKEKYSKVDFELVDDIETRLSQIERLLVTLENEHV